jgi:hypothetical protein
MSTQFAARSPRRTELLQEPQELVRIRRFRDVRIESGLARAATSSGAA